MQFAIRFPEMVERLVVVNSFPRFRSRWKIKIAAAFAPIAPRARSPRSRETAVRSVDKISDNRPSQPPRTFTDFQQYRFNRLDIRKPTMIGGL